MKVCKKVVHRNHTYTANKVLAQSVVQTSKRLKELNGEHLSKKKNHECVRERCGVWFESLGQPGSYTISLKLDNLQSSSHRVRCKLEPQGKLDDYQAFSRVLDESLNQAIRVKEEHSSMNGWMYWLINRTCDGVSFVLIFCCC